MSIDTAKNTDQITEEGYDLNEAILREDQEAIDKIRLRESRRRGSLRWASLYRKDGELKDCFQAGRLGACVIGFIAALGVAVFFGFWTVPAFTPNLKGGEIIADIFIILGTGFTASGVVLNRSTTRWLSEIVEQEENILNKTKIVRQVMITRDLLAMIRCIKATIEPGSVNQSDGHKPPSLNRLMVKLEKRLRKETSGRAHVYVISQKDLAKAFLAASKTSLFGTLLILVGTVGLAMLALKK